MDNLAQVLRAAIALFIIIDPIGLIPVFMALTHDATPQERRSILTQATYVAFVLMLLFAFTGHGILRLFAISISDFKIAGGILLLVIALRIINEAHYGMSPGGRPGVVPIAVPLLVGPGAITTTIVLIGTQGLWTTVSAVVAVFLVSYVIFRYVGRLYVVLGKTGSDVVAKLMGMLLAAIAIQFVREGLQEIFRA
jgi:multiple antibiotic resistance protein